MNPRRRSLAVAAACLALVLAAAAFGLAQDGKKIGEAKHGKLVFANFSGTDDVLGMNAAVRHAKRAKDSGFLEEVAVLYYGPGVQALTADLPKRADFAREAQASGVRLIVCARSLKVFKIAQDKLDPKPDEIVPDGVVRLAELVSQGYQVIRY